MHGQPKHLHASQILKKNEQMYALLACVVALCPAAHKLLDENVATQVCNVARTCVSLQRDALACCVCCWALGHSARLLTNKQALQLPTGDSF